MYSIPPHNFTNTVAEFVDIYRGRIRPLLEKGDLAAVHTLSVKLYAEQMGLALTTSSFGSLSEKFLSVLKSLKMASSPVSGIKPMHMPRILTGLDKLVAEMETAINPGEIQ